MKQVKIIGQMDNTKDGTFESANRVYGKSKAAPTIPTCGGGGIQPKVIKKWKRRIKMSDSNKEPCIEDYLYKGFGVFKLSHRECGRMMGVKDSDIDKMEKVNYKTQCYKQFGNSICVPVLMAIFSQLGLPGVPKWNDLTQEQRQALVDKDMEFLKGGD